MRKKNILDYSHRIKHEHLQNNEPRYLKLRIKDLQPQEGESEGCVLGHFRGIEK